MVEQYRLISLEQDMQKQYNVLGCRTNLYFHGYNLAIKIDENGHSDWYIDNKITNQKAIQGLDCEFIWIDLDKEDFDSFRAINEIFRHIKQLTTNTLINKISRRLLGLEFKPDNIIRSKVIKFIVTKILPDYK